MHPLDALFVKVPLDEIFVQHKKSNDVVQSKGEHETNDDSKSRKSGNVEYRASITQL